MKTAISCIILAILWLIVTESRVIPPLFLPHPKDVIGASRILLYEGAAATTLRAITGFILGILLAYFVHFVCVLCKTEKGMDAQFAGMRAVPVIAVMPLFVVWFGFAETGRLLIVILSSMAFFIAPFHEAYKHLGREWTILKEQLSLSPIAYYVQIVVPGTLGSLLGTLRVTLAVAFTISIASEYIGAQIGLGRFLDSARVTFNVPAIFLAIIVASVIGILMDKVVTSLFLKFVHWAGRDAKA
jgi:ABC-type nitrate/sulfonate/bicarbonate transport system permease component